MCNTSVIKFCKNSISENEIRDKKVLEVGSLDVNGSIRNYVEYFNPSKFIGIDIQDGPNVDIVLNAYDIVNRFGKNMFDVVICTEVVEHVEDWRLVFKNIKNVLIENGIVILTTRSKNSPYHGYPFDHWRYEISDMKKIFSDFKILKLFPDNLMPGFYLSSKTKRIYPYATRKYFPLFNKYWYSS
jgi:SAM-dependent methyltransferase